MKKLHKFLYLVIFTMTILGVCSCGGPIKRTNSEMKGDDQTRNPDRERSYEERYDEGYDEMEEQTVTHDPEMYKTNSRIAIERAKQIFYAVANGDVRKIRNLTTDDFYDDKFGMYSDDEVREILLNVPYERRQEMINQIQNDVVPEVIMNRAGDVMTVILTNNRTGKDFMVQFIDTDGYGDWRIFDYTYNR